MNRYLMQAVFFATNVLGIMDLLDGFELHGTSKVCFDLGSEHGSFQLLAISDIFRPRLLGLNTSSFRLFCLKL